MSWIQLDEQDFDEIFHLIPASDGDCSWEENEILDSGIPTCRVWTIVEGEDGTNNLYLLPGFHYVNRFGLAVSVVSWDPADEGVIEGIYMTGVPSCERCGVDSDSMAAEDWDDECGTCRECCDSPMHRSSE